MVHNCNQYCIRLGIRKQTQHETKNLFFTNMEKEISYEKETKIK